MATRLSRGYCLYSMPTVIKKLIQDFDDLFTLLSQYWKYSLMPTTFEAMCGHFLQRFRPEEFSSAGAAA